MGFSLKCQTTRAKCEEEAAYISYVVVHVDKFTKTGKRVSTMRKVPTCARHKEGAQARLLPWAYKEDCNGAEVQGR